MSERFWVRCEIPGHGGHETHDGCVFCREYVYEGVKHPLRVPLECPEHGGYLSCDGCCHCRKLKSEDKKAP